MQKLRCLLICLALVVHGRREVKIHRLGESLKLLKNDLSNPLSYRPVRCNGENALASVLLSHRRALLPRRAALVGSFALLAPISAFSESQPSAGTLSLKGVSGLSSLTGADKPRPFDLGIIGRGIAKDKPGRFNSCEVEGCVSTFERDSIRQYPSYEWPWVYQVPRRLTPDGEWIYLDPNMPLEKTSSDVRGVVEEAGGKVVTVEDRYIYAEFEDSFTGAVDDVEFLLSTDAPRVDYRSSPRSGGAYPPGVLDKLQRERMENLLTSLQAKSNVTGELGVGECRLRNDNGACQIFVGDFGWRLQTVSERSKQDCDADRPACESMMVALHPDKAIYNPNRPKEEED